MNNTQTGTQNNTLFKDYLEPLGINYIKHQQLYLIISFLVPIISLTVSIINLFLIFFIPPDHPPRLPPIDPLQISFQLGLPFFIIVIFSVFALMKFILLFKWYKQLKQYEINKNVEKDKQQIRKKSVSLTEMFYVMVSYMERIRWIFIILNVVFLLNIHWYLNFFLRQLNLVNPFQPSLHPPNALIHWLNVGSQLLLLFYLLYEWYHFMKWNRKLSKLNRLEHAVYDELQLNNDTL